MKYILAIAVFIVTGCQSQIHQSQEYSLVIYNFVTSDWKHDSFHIWYSKKQKFNGIKDYMKRELIEDDTATFVDGTSIYFSKDKLFLNKQRQNLKPGNYILKDGHFYQGFIRSFD